MHVDVTTHENNFLRMDRLKPALQPTLCASLRGRNAHGQNTRAILCGNLQGKCRIWEWAPRSSTGLYPYRKNPSIWTHCLAKNPENRKGAEKWIERRRDENRDKTHKWRKDAWMVSIFDDFCDACGTFMVICKAVIAKHGRFVSCKGGRTKYQRCLCDGCGCAIGTNRKCSSSSEWIYDYRFMGWVISCYIPIYRDL